MLHFSVMGLRARAANIILRQRLRAFSASMNLPSSYTMKFNKIRCDTPCCFWWRSKWFIVVVAWLAFTCIEKYRSVRPSFPHWGRIRRLVQNVDYYAEMIPLEYIQDNPDFNIFAERLKTMQGAPYVVFFDMSNIDVLLNHICNIKFMPGVLPRLAAVAFEPEAERMLNRKYPDIPTVTIDYTPVKREIPPDLENKKYLTYQLILMLRARVASALAYRGIDFWAMQQDTIWTDNFSTYRIEERYDENHLIFDTVGNDKFHIYNNMKGWICGSTFFVRASPLTAEFFNKVALLMRRRQSPDSSIMTYLCNAPHYKCLKLPRWLISNSNFFMGNRKPMSQLIQVATLQSFSVCAVFFSNMLRSSRIFVLFPFFPVDHSSPLSKMDLFRKWNLDFTLDNGECNATAVVHVKDAVIEALPEVREQETEDLTPVYKKLYLALHEFIGFDPFYTRRFLRVHETLV